jgi:hypothetical protein
MEQSSGAGRAVARTTRKTAHHSEGNLERYYLGMILEGPELDAFEEHLLACPKCVDLAEASDAYVDTIRAGIILGQFDRI